MSGQISLDEVKNSQVGKAIEQKFRDRAGPLEDIYGRDVKDLIPEIETKLIELEGEFS